MTSLNTPGSEQFAYRASSESLLFDYTGNSSSLDDILKSTKEHLIDFSSSDAAVEQMMHLFENAKVADVEYLLSAWSSGDFSTLPTFAVLNDVSMQGAQGAFASESNTVYLNRRLTQQRSSQHFDPIIGAVGIAIEEIGHSVDELLNPNGDTAGDEGELFRAVVLGQVLSDAQRDKISQEDDTGTVIINNRAITVEQATRRGNSASNTLRGTSSADYLYGKDGNDKLYGYRGNDKLYGGTGNDKLYGSSGNDYLSGWSGDDYLSGWSGSDRLYGGSGNDRLYGGSGSDRLYGSSGKDRLYGSSGDDRLYGSSGDDVLYGGSGDDKLYGGTNNDYLSGYTGNDYLSGWSGDDRLKAYGGGTNERDVLRGGSGRDTFFLGDAERAYYLNSGNADYATLRDLIPNEDTVQLNKLNNTRYSATRAYGYRLQVDGDDTWLRRDSDGQAIALIEGQTNLNLLSDTFSYVGKADLSFNSASASPTVYTNGQLQLAVNIKNNGVVASEMQNMRYWLSDDAKLDTAVDWQLLGHSSSAQAAGTSRNFNWNIAYNTAWGTGQKYVFFQIDNGDDVEESNESNNIISQQITLSAPKPDLVIQNQNAPSSVVAGNTVNISAYTKNSGNSAASGSHNIRYWLSNDTTLNTSTDRYLGSDAVGSLTAGSREYDSFSFTYNAAWGTGSKYILFQADGGSNVSEANENNNIAYRAINVQQLKPDLGFYQVVGSRNITAGDSTTINTKIHNRSTATAVGTSSQLRYWLSDDAVINTATDRYLGSDTVGALAPNASEQESFTFTYNTAWGTGTKYFISQIDGTSRVAESNESNNTYATRLSVASPKPDLIISGTYGSSSVTAGQTVNVGAHTKNNSTLATAGSSQIRYWLSNDKTLNTSTDRYLGSDSVGVLGKRASEADSISFTYNASWGTGTKYILFQADGGSQVAESNENNNVAYRAIVVTSPQSDLVVQGQYATANSKIGRTVSIGAQTRNIGQASASAGSISYWLSDDASLNTSTDRYLGIDHFGALSVGQVDSHNYAFIYDASWGIGTKYIFFKTDYKNQNAELNEHNNIAYKAINVSALKADLVAKNQSVPSVVTAGDSVTISTETKNQTPFDVVSNYSYTQYWLSDDTILNTSTDRFLGNDYVASLSKGSSEYDTHTFTYNKSWGTGRKYIFFKIDSSNSVDEENEDNNVSYRVINVSTHKSDLIVHDQYATPSVTTGGLVQINSHTKNNASGAITSGNSVLKYWLSDDTTLNTATDRFLGYDHVGSLASGISEFDSHSFTYDVSWGTGKKYILFSADANNDVAESIENNNIAYSTVTVTAPRPDLSISNQSAPTTVTTGNTITLSAQTKNNSSINSRSSSVRYWLSDDRTLNTATDRSIGFTNVGALSGGGTETSTFSFNYNASWGTGTKYMFFQADGFNVVSETNENNNTSYRTIVVSPAKPDLVVQNQYAPATAITGKTVSVGAYTRNNGAAKANSHQMKYWLSDDANFNPLVDQLLGSQNVGSLTQYRSEYDSLTFSYDAAWGIGTKYIFFQADGNYGVSESDEDNNIVYRAITVSAGEAEAPETYKPFNVSKVFSLNSKVDAKHTIYLDFDGHTTTNTTWNSRYNNDQAITSRRYDTDNNTSNFSLAERETIWRIWQRVAEDFAPFNINVTTAEPVAGDLIKASSNDSRWGIRVVIGGNSNDWYTDDRPDRPAGGVATLTSFNYGIDHPTFVFSENLTRDPDKSIAEAVSHEVGHTLGLRHHGNDANNNNQKDENEEYYRGHGTGITGWAPIIGVGYYQELTQWSTGEYQNPNAHANNKDQDDLAIITQDNGFGYRPDDHGTVKSQATTLLPFTGSQVKAYGIIEKNTDFDWFEFTSSTGRIKLNFDVFERGANLDILAELYNEAGQRIAFSNPKEELKAMFNLSLSPGKYYVSVSGTGKSGTDGYSSYGSLGQYSITGTIA